MNNFQKKFFLIRLIYILHDVNYYYLPIIYQKIEIIYKLKICIFKDNHIFKKICN